MTHIAHFAINADDLERAKKFYAAVFGWAFEAWGPPGFYMLKGAEGPGKMHASIQTRRNIVPGKSIFGLECTLAVDNSEKAEAAIKKAGGKIVMPRAVIAGVGKLFFFEDTEGNIVGAMEYDSNAR